MDKLLFGTAGIPISAKMGDTITGIKQVRNIGLEAMELEFVRNVNISEEKAPEVQKVARENDVVLTCHAPYYINLNAKDSKILEASKKRILHSARIAYLCGAYSVCFHPGFYMGMEKQKVYENVKKALSEIVGILKSEGVKIWVRPELTGKPTQFGGIEELARMSSEIEGVMPCVDFSHCHARTNGKYNTYKEFISILEIIERSLGKQGLENIHAHVSGIEYGPKGEKNHLNLKESDLNFLELIKAWKDFRIKGVVVSESPNIEGDAMLMKRIYYKSP